MLYFRGQRRHELPHLCVRITHALQAVQRVAEFLRAQILSALLHFRCQRRHELPHLLRIAQRLKSVHRVADRLRIEVLAALLHHLNDRCCVCSSEPSLEESSSHG